MKPLLILLLAGSFFANEANAQNLVPNPDFELRDSDYCGIAGPTDLANSLSDWYSPTNGTPDVFFTDILAECWNFQPNSTYPGPIGLKGEQLPRSGSSMAGIGLYTIANLNQREYIQVQFTSPLVSSGKYLVECYVSLAEFTEFASNGIGFHLSTNAISSSNNGVLPFSPQYETIDVIGEVQNWVRVFDTVTVTDAFEFLTIGNFGNDSTTTLQANPTASGDPGTYGAFYFIDDVKVERVFDDPTSSIHQLDILNIHVFPNPTADNITIELPKAEVDVEIELIDVRGNLVWSITDSFKERLIDLKDIDSGVYFIRIKSELGRYTERIVKK